MIGFKWSLDETIQCLKECGCDSVMAERYITYEQENRSKDQIRFLNRKRCSLMDDLHENQRKVDCIDFMIRELEQIVKG